MRVEIYTRHIMSNKLRVAIIDDGIAKCLPGELINKNIEINSNNILLQSNGEDKLTHGTICASIIEKYAHNISSISSIKILDHNGNGNITQLYTALEWCIQYNINVVNLSLGSIYFDDMQSIRKIVNRCASLNIILVCAASNSDFITYPSSFSNAIGVSCDYNNIYDLSKNQYYMLNNKYQNGIDIVAYSEHKLYNPITHNYYTSDKCNSFATPMITAKICNMISEDNNININTLLNKLKNDAVNDCKNENRIKNYLYIDWIIKAIIIDIDYDEKTSWDYYFDIILHLSYSTMNIESIMNKIANYTFDTLIIRAKTPINIHQESLDSLLSLEKNIVLININPEHNYDKINAHMLWHNQLKYNAILNNSHQSHNAILNIPNLCIFYDKNIDVIMFSCYLRECFGKKGYNINLINDEASCILYDIDYIPLDCIRNDHKKAIDYISYFTFLANYDLNIWFSSNDNKDYYNKILSQLKYDIIIEINMIHYNNIILSVLTDNQQKYSLTFESLTKKNIESFFDLLIKLLS
ncbi:S8 family serine peptidase [Vallitalea guaymasensis]|uniref:S8 family serine peptidase n=1 Tax=Vallitalea guaymasensis TaxID=1185412 RepID=A0A8J8MAL1_9FIRM|nr:S8 family serine peptidase [Vallitalea guaymasensis]QUH29446.1 S8 family serine peptidase [Vallitalea guaymasensis]